MIPIGRCHSSQRQHRRVSTTHAHVYAHANALADIRGAANHVKLITATNPSDEAAHKTTGTQQDTTASRVSSFSLFLTLRMLASRKLQGVY